MAAVIKEANALGKPIAAQTGGVVLLAKAGIMSGRKYAHSSLHLDLQDAIYSGNGVIQDGKIITSGMCPYLAKHWKGVQTGTSELTQAFIAELKK